MHRGRYAKLCIATPYCPESKSEFAVDLRSRAVVEAQHSSKSLVAPYRQSKCASDNGALQQAVTHSLMIALAMVMPHELPDGVLERGLSEENHSAQELRFDLAHEAFG